MAAVETSRGGGGAGGRGRRGGAGGGEASFEVRASKNLAYLLRHGATKEGLKIRPDGFVNVDEILAHLAKKQLKLGPRQLQDIVDNNDKKRFELKSLDGVLHIRAVQGHSLNHIQEESLMTKLTAAAAAAYPTVVHGTYFSSWASIAVQGLSKMGRNHIHFAIGEPGEAGVISGMRRSAQVLVFIDLAAAIADGIDFYRSNNDVILTPGDAKGFLAPKYFKQVIDARTRQPVRIPSGGTTASASSSSASASPAVEEEFDYLCVLDFEATCEDGKKIQQEVIELPGVLVDVKNKKIVGQIQFYTKPVVNPKLTPFCTSLTGITQETIDTEGIPFHQAWKQYNTWLNDSVPGLLERERKEASTPLRFAFVTCGDWDLKSMLPAQINLLKKSTLADDQEVVRSIESMRRYNSWINLKIAFQRFMGLRSPPRGMTDMLDRFQLKLEGRHHSGIDDCNNIARVLLQMLEKGYKPSYTWTARR